MPEEVNENVEQEAPEKKPKDIVIETFKTLPTWKEEWEPIIDFQEDHFLLYYGDIENIHMGGSRQTDGDGSKYFLLDTYVKIPYNLNPGECKLYRGVLNEYELMDNGRSFTGFVHFSGCMNDGGFCYGESGVESLLHEMSLAIQDEKILIPERLDQLYILFKNYLSQSNHNTWSDYAYKKLDLPSSDTNVNYKVLRWINYDGVLVPTIFKEITKKRGIIGIDYDQPYESIVKEFTNKKFEFKGKTITPIAVKHHYIIDEVEREELKYLNIKQFIRNAQNRKIRELRSELNNQARFTLSNYFLKLPDKLKRMDGSVYL